MRTTFTSGTYIPLNSIVKTQYVVFTTHTMYEVRCIYYEHTGTYSSVLAHAQTRAMHANG